MKHSLAALLVTAIACLPITAVAQDKPAFALRTFEAAKQKNAKITALKASLDQKINLAFKGEEKLRAAMTADLKAIQAEKNPQARKKLAAAYRAKYDKDSKRIMAKASIDMQSIANQMRTIDPSMTYTVVANRVVGRQSAVSQDPPTQLPPPPPAAAATVRDLQAADYRFERNSDCSSGWGETTRSGASVTSDSEGCLAEGSIIYELVVPEDKNVRIEITGDLYAEAHTIASSASALSSIDLINMRNADYMSSRFVSTFVVELMFGDDAIEEVQGASIVRDLEPGRYKIQAFTSSYGSNHTPGWAVAEASLKSLRVRITTSPK